MLKEAYLISQLVVRNYAYIDTVVVWFHITLKPKHVTEIKRRCDGDAWINYDKPMKHQPSWRCKVTMQKPRDACFHYLEALAAGGLIENYPYYYLINQVHFALDFITLNQADAEIVHQFLAKHFVKLWPGKTNLN